MKQRLPLMITVVGLILSCGSAVASAATVRQGPPTHNRYCVARAVPTGGSQTSTLRCYRSFAASIKAATGGRVRLPAGTRPGSVTPDMINDAETPATTYVLGIDFVDGGFSSADGTLTLIQSAKCGNFQLSSMPSGWNDVVSSASTSSGCASILYQNVNFGGTTLRVPKNGGVGVFGSFNDQTSSQKWCASC